METGAEESGKKESLVKERFPGKDFRIRAIPDGVEKPGKASTQTGVSSNGNQRGPDPLLELTRSVAGHQGRDGQNARKATKEEWDEALGIRPRRRIQTTDENTPRTDAQPNPPAPSLEADVIGDRVSAIFRNLREDHPDHSVESKLRTLWKQKVPSRNILESLLHHIQKKAGASSIALLLFDSKTCSRRSVISLGMDPYTVSNFHLGLNDLFLDPDKRIFSLPFQGNLSRDFTFRKRFSSTFFKRMEGAIFLNLELFHCRGYLVFFYRNMRKLTNNPEDESLFRELLGLLRDLLPGVIRYGRHHGFTGEHQIHPSRSFYQELKEISSCGKDRIQIVYLESLDLAGWKNQMGALVKELHPALDPAERICIFGPSRIAVLLKKTGVEKITGILERMDGYSQGSFRWSVATYPESRKNFHTLIHPPWELSSHLSQVWRVEV